MAKPPPFTVAIDNREKAPYEFKRLPATSVQKCDYFDAETETHYLLEGDYSIVGTYRLVAVERKSLQDLYGTLGSHRERFEREIQRLSEYKFAAVVVEASFRQMCKPASFESNWRSNLHPRSVMGTMIAWGQRYPSVSWLLAGDRRGGEVLTYEFLRLAWKAYCVEQEAKP